MLIALIKIVSSFEERKAMSSHLSKSARQFIEDAIRHYKERRYHEALEAFDYAIQLDPASVRALHGRGIVLVQIKEYNNAIKSFEQASKLAPNVAQIYADMAEVFYIVGDYEKSCLYYKKAVELDRKYESLLLSKVPELVDYAINLNNQGLKDKAIDVLQLALLLNPVNNRAMSFLSVLQNSNSYAYDSSVLPRGVFEDPGGNDLHHANCRCPICMNY